MAPPKGFIPWNKGLKGIHLSQATEFKKGEHRSTSTEFKKGMIPWNKGLKGTHFSVKTEFTSEGTLGKNNSKWKGGKVGYFASHSWMQRNYGKASMCENRVKGILDFLCSRKSKKYDWAFKSKKGFRRDRKSYMQLCHSCHLKYDRTK